MSYHILTDAKFRQLNRHYLCTVINWSYWSCSIVADISMAVEVVFMWLRTRKHWQEKLYRRHRTLEHRLRLSVYAKKYNSSTFQENLSKVMISQCQILLISDQSQPVLIFASEETNAENHFDMKSNHRDKILKHDFFD